MNSKLKYEPLVQKPQLCFPTILSMIALRRNYSLSQEEIAKKLNIKVTKEAIKQIKAKINITPDSLDAGYDIQHINLAKLNKFLEKISMKAEFKKASEIKNIDNFIEKNIEDDNDVAMLFLWKAFGYKVDFAHYVLISSYNKDTKQVEVSDPGIRDNKKVWKAKIDEFLLGMDKKWDGKERGFFIFKNTKNNY